MKTLRIVDIETSGEDPETGEIIEIACFDVGLGEPAPTNQRSSLIKPSRPIPAEASAIHHITDAMVEHALSPHGTIAEMLLEPPEPFAYIAHGAKFEQAFIGSYLAGITWCCTYKAALRIVPDAPNHSLQTLRYWLKVDGKLNGQRQDGFPVHRAMPDCVVTAAVLGELIKRHAGMDEAAAIADMIAWTAEPPLMPKIPFGKHRGEAWEMPEENYLRWVVDKSDMDDDIKANCLRELRRRYVERDMAGVGTEASAEALKRRWLTEAGPRAYFEITTVTPEYEKLAQAYGRRKAELVERAEA